MVKGFPFFYLLFHYRTNGIAAAPVVAVQRIDGRTKEAQAVTADSAAGQSRPRAAARAYIGQRP